MVRARVALVIILGFILVSAGLAYYLTTTSTGTLAIRIHDVPASWSHVTVTFSQVAVHPANAANDSGWIVLPLAETQIDFLALGNLTTLLALDRVAPGAYAQIRIIVASVQGVLVGGASVSMTVPDGSVQTATPFTVQGGGATTVTLDLDLSLSIRPAGELWIFTPVLGRIRVS
jgi:hypothetical protein